MSDIKLNIKVYPISEPKNSTVALASVGIEDLVAITGVRVVNGEKGLFVAMPQSKDKDGNYHDIAYPINGDLRKEINRAVIAEYQSAEKTAERKTTLADSLRNGVAKAAEYNASRDKTQINSAKNQELG